MQAVGVLLGENGGDKGAIRMGDYANLDSGIKGGSPLVMNGTITDVPAHTHFPAPIPPITFSTPSESSAATTSAATSVAVGMECVSCMLTWRIFTQRQGMPVAASLATNGRYGNRPAPTPTEGEEARN